MTNLEIENIREFMKKQVFSTKEEILEAVLVFNPNRNPSNSRFYLFDLVRANVLYKYDSKRYKYNGKLKQFEYKSNDSDIELKNKIESHFEDIQLCIWNTSFLSNYLNLMPYSYFTFIESDKNYIELIFDYLKSFYNVLLTPTQKELDFYVQKNNQIILRNLINRAPIDKKYANYIGINKSIYRTSRVVYNPKIEKILVDIFVEKNNFSIFDELNSIFIGLLSTYCVNFQKLFYYAKNRGVFEELSEFIVYEIMFDLEKGEIR